MNYKPLISVLIFVFLCLPAQLFGEGIDRMTMNALPVYRSWAEQDSTFTCGVIIQTPAKSSPRKLPVHVVVAIDVSRAMQGEPLTYAKKSADLILSKLKDGDYFSVITFSTYARTVFPLQPINEGIRRSAKSGIDGIAGESNRNTVEGMNAAVAQFERFKGQAASGRHLFIITNGDADNGITDNSKILSRAYSLSQNASINISTFGIEYAYNEKLLAQMADKTGGRYYYAEEPELLNANVDREISRITVPAARSVKLRIEPPKPAEVAKVYGGEKDGSGIIVGDLPAATKLFVFFELSGRPDQQKDCIVEMEYTEPESQNTRRQRDYIDIALTDGTPDYEPAIFPYYLVFSFINELVTYAGHVHENRRGYTDFFRSRLIDIEQENVSLESEFLSKSYAYFQQIDRRISNTAIEPEEYIKGIKFDVLQYLRGNLIE